MSVEAIESSIDQCIQGFQKNELFNWAVEHFVAFVGANFAGLSVTDDWVGIDGFSQDQLEKHAFMALAFGLNKPFGGARCIARFWLAKKALLDSPVFDIECTFVHQLWRFRILNIWAAILPERELKLKLHSDALLNSLDHLAQQSVSLDSNHHIAYFLEKVHYHIHYYEYLTAKSALDKALQLAGIQKVEFSGALGRRTRFQQNDVPQLLLKIELSDENCVTIMRQSKENLPRNCLSADDTLLEGINFADANENAKQQLNSVQSACILAMALLDRFADVSTRGLGIETSMIYLEEVIRQETCWSVQLRALIERSNIEMHNSRRIERACSQLESIANLLNSNSVDSGVRLELLFSTAPLPFWEVNKLHAKVLRSLGCITESLHKFEQLGLWDDVVECYLCLRQPEKAESLIRKLLEQKENALYLCLLGDISNNAEYYNRAIQVSDDKSARARSSLGQLMLKKKQYVASVQHYSRALEIQPLQLGSWFNLGYAAMKMEDYQAAVHAYHRCVSIEPEHFEAWNNLAASYIHLGQKHRAQKMILEALKLNWGSIAVWDNLLLISTDIGDYKQAISALEKLLDIDQKRNVDELPLKMISLKLFESDEDVDELLRSLMPIFARINARQSLSPELLRIFAKLKCPTSEQREDIAAWTAYTQLLERAFQREYGQITSQLEPQICTKMLVDHLALINEMKHVWRIQKLKQEQIKSQLRLRVQPTISVVERHFGPNCADSDDNELKEQFKLLKELLID